MRAAYVRKYQKKYVHSQEGDIVMVRYPGEMNEMTAPYGGPYKTARKEGHEYFVCILDKTKDLEYPNSASDELIGLVKKTIAGVEFTPTVKYNHQKRLSSPRYLTTNYPHKVMEPRTTYYNGQMGSVPERMNQTSQMLIFLHYTDSVPRVLMSDHRATGSVRGGELKPSFLTPKDTLTFLTLKNAPPTNQRNKDQILGCRAPVDIHFPKPS
ncbi:hypothetical protein SARC_11326 [Sphaeroforma arctica JP610]|uniref:Uncharacterized protein n=1 Tax=Sphaeroforma arctica JP610 TaxID=667725 RepID=A0A0L0FHE3_9EUKA|nr:hypothetical protein SARC_11326 [Sphaeroforma arctica JP610]KNC76165.1 hypothetical protein SARC_11326 [Sphaeroforma arctica JP610]|eukprot:XP_014150067.1 hypothetical protein SARC_11326 [Sphaeroforma arctica JP610]